MLDTTKSLFSPEMHHFLIPEAPKVLAAADIIISKNDASTKIKINNATQNQEADRGYDAHRLQIHFSRDLFLDVKNSIHIEIRSWVSRLSEEIDRDVKKAPVEEYGFAII